MCTYVLNYIVMHMRVIGFACLLVCLSFVPLGIIYYTRYRRIKIYRNRILKATSFPIAIEIHTHNCKCWRVHELFIDYSAEKTQINFN